MLSRPGMYAVFNQRYSSLTLKKEKNLNNIYTVTHFT